MEILEIPSKDQILWKAYDYVIFTDGSGYQDGYGGAASLIYSYKYLLADKPLIKVVADSVTTVDRMEFVALLNALQHIEAHHPEKLSKAVRRRILWYCDREALVKSVNGEYKRKASKDLWHWFSYFEPYFNVSGVHLKRTTNPEHDKVDLLASDARTLIKDYMESVQFNAPENLETQRDV